MSRARCRSTTLASAARLSVQPSGRHEKLHKYHAEIDLKPTLSEEQFMTASGILPCWLTMPPRGRYRFAACQYMQPVMVARWGIDSRHKGQPDHPGAEAELVCLMKHCRTCPSMPGRFWPMRSSPPAVSV